MGVGGQGFLYPEDGGHPQASCQQRPVEGGAASQVCRVCRATVPGKWRGAEDMASWAIYVQNLSRVLTQPLWPPLAAYSKGVAPPLSLAVT